VKIGNHDGSMTSLSSLAIYMYGDWFRRDVPVDRLPDGFVPLSWAVVAFTTTVTVPITRTAATIHYRNMLYYCDIIFICWTFHFVYYVGRTTNKFKIPTHCWFNVIVVFNLKINEGSTNMSIIMKAQNFMPLKIKWFHSIRNGISKQK